MFCSKCGKQNQDDAAFCNSCGAKIAPQQQYPIQPETNAGNSYQWPLDMNPNVTPVSQIDIVDAESKSRASLVMGVLSIVFCWLMGIPGIILGALAISNGKKARLILNESYYMFWNALAGVITGSIGLAFSIISTVCYLIFITVCYLTFIVAIPFR